MFGGAAAFADAPTPGAVIYVSAIHDDGEIYECRKGYILTPAQIERGLNDPSELMRARIAGRPKVT